MGKRKLTLNEKEQAGLVFGYSLDFERVTIHEGARWPNFLGKIGARLRKEKPPSANAVTIGQHVFFPRKLAEFSTAASGKGLTDTAWLIHELTHVWQFQNLGAWYSFKTVWLHLKSRFNIYQYGGPEELERQMALGNGFLSFNQEQQGEITRDYYLRLKRNLDLSAWEPYIRELQKF
jgi:hypothetical protein